MAYAAGFDAYPDLARARIANGLAYELEPSRSHSLHRLIGRRAFHHSVPSTDFRRARCSVCPAWTWHFPSFGGVKAIALSKSNNLNCDSLQSVSCKESLFDAMQGTAATG